MMTQHRSGFDSVVHSVDVTCANSYYSRLVGFMGRSEVLASEGILFPRCNSVHMWFMRTSLDILFLKTLPLKQQGKNLFKILDIRTDVRPWLLFPLINLKSDSVLEVRAGSCLHLDLRIGDELWFD